VEKEEQYQKIALNLYMRDHERELIDESPEDKQKVLDSIY